MHEYFFFGYLYNHTLVEQWCCCGSIHFGPQQRRNFAIFETFAFSILFSNSFSQALPSEAPKANEPVRGVQKSTVEWKPKVGIDSMATQQALSTPPPPPFIFSVLTAHRCAKENRGRTSPSSKGNWGQAKSRTRYSVHPTSPQYDVLESVSSIAHTISRCTQEERWGISQAEMEWRRSSQDRIGLCSHETSTRFVMRGGRFRIFGK